MGQRRGDVVWQGLVDGTGEKPETVRIVLLANGTTCYETLSYDSLANEAWVNLPHGALMARRALELAFVAMTRAVALLRAQNANLAQEVASLKSAR
jgi:hypothetical protein